MEHQSVACSADDSESNTETEFESTDNSSVEQWPVSTSTPDNADNSLTCGRTRRIKAGVPIPCYCCRIKGGTYTNIKGRRPIHTPIKTPSRLPSTAPTEQPNIPTEPSRFLVEPKTPEVASPKKALLFGVETLKKILGPITRRRSLYKRKSPEDEEDTQQPSTSLVQSSSAKRRRRGSQGHEAPPSLIFNTNTLDQSQSSETFIINSHIKLEVEGLNSLSEVIEQIPVANCFNISRSINNPLENGSNSMTEFTIKVEKDSDWDQFQIAQEDALNSTINENNISQEGQDDSSLTKEGRKKSRCVLM